MKLNVGDVVKCESSGPHAGERIGKIRELTKRVDGTFGEPALVGYIDYPEEFPGGWFTGVYAWVRKCRVIINNEMRKK